MECEGGDSLYVLWIEYLYNLFVCFKSVVSVS